MLADILVEVPSNIIIKIIGAKTYLPALVMAFGIVSMCTSFVHNYPGLLACRFFLGIAEGGMMPGAAYYLSCFYRRHELLFRLNLFISGATLAGAFGGLLAAGLTQIPRWGVDPPNGQPLHTWRNIFFFEGILTILIAASVMFYLPNTPDKCKFLSPQDQYIALERINREHKESVAEKIRPYHVYRAVFNINNILCALGFFFVNVSVQSVSLFLPTILNALGWTAIRSQLYSVPPYVTACVWSIFISWVSDKYKRRGVFIVLGNTLAMIGYIMLVTTDKDAVKYLGVFFAACGAFPLGPFYLAWGLNNAAGPSIRAVTGAYIVALGTFGAILATWTYRDSDKPAFRKGHSINLATNVCSIITAISCLIYVKWENNRRAAGKRDHRLEGLTEDEKNQLGYQHPEFRYTE